MLAATLCPSRIAHSDLPDLNPANDQDDAQVFLSPLRISKAADVAYTGSGSNITYTITVTNVLQTSAGRMIFGRLESDKNGPRRRS
jgi:hypothetical protein